jgi:hypothetical protein
MIITPRCRDQIARYQYDGFTHVSGRLGGSARETAILVFMYMYIVMLWVDSIHGRYIYIRECFSPNDYNQIPLTNWVGRYPANIRQSFL